MVNRIWILSRAVEFFLLQAARVKELTKTNSKELPTKWYAWRAMLFELCHLSRNNWIFSSAPLLCWNLFCIDWHPTGQTTSSFFFYSDCIISIEILNALWSIQRSMTWQNLTKNLLCDFQNRLIVWKLNPDMYCDTSCITSTWWWIFHINPRSSG